MRMRSKCSVCLLLFFNFLLFLVFVGSDFYSLFTEQFEVTKKENYLTLLLLMPYVLYLAIVGRKVLQEEKTVPGMRNLEFLVYFSLLGGLWQVWQVFSTWSDYSSLKNQYLLPDNFYLVGLGLLAIFALFYAMSFYLFSVRRRVVGPYHRREWEENFEVWEEFQMRQKAKVPVNNAD